MLTPYSSTPVHLIGVFLGEMWGIMTFGGERLLLVLLLVRV